MFGRGRNDIVEDVSDQWQLLVAGAALSLVAALYLRHLDHTTRSARLRRRLLERLDIHEKLPSGVAGGELLRNLIQEDLHLYLKEFQPSDAPVDHAEFELISWRAIIVAGLIAALGGTWIYQLSESGLFAEPTNASPTFVDVAAAIAVFATFVSTLLAGYGLVDRFVHRLFPNWWERLEIQKIQRRRAIAAARRDLDATKHALRDPQASRRR